MRFATYQLPGATLPQAGVVHADRAKRDLVHPLPAGTSVLDVVRSGLPAALALGAAAVRDEPGVPLGDVVLDVPLRPPSVRDFVTFEEHVEGVRRSIEGQAGVSEAWYDAPTFYFTNPHAVLATGVDVVAPASCQALDFELEVAVVVAAGGTSLSAETAREHVFGYLIMNDWSARDLQRREMQIGLGPAKGKDFATTLGPWIVTGDELEPYRDPEGFLDLWCTVQVNGAQVGSDLLSNMGWTFETMIAYASRDSRIEAGDVLGSGTVGHGGCLAELWGRRGSQDPPALRPGDEVSMSVQGLGRITNRVTTGPAAPVLPAVRRRDPAAARAHQPLSGRRT